jgi:RecQ family ATP-dependent DNA helicase
LLLQIILHRCHYPHAFHHAGIRLVSIVTVVAATRHGNPRRRLRFVILTTVATILPQPTETLVALLQRAFDLPSFRVNQEVVCRAVIEGRDVLLVMPTGAGKSLCFQLPGIARGGTTLVISPLIALMEDQAAKLASLGFSVARIHSGLDRAFSRQACAQYLAGTLQFLFIAPERLRVPGFIEMLAKRKPSLIAIDEAHCISQWGHDFRPDYRMLGQFVPALRPAPVIALTATATPRVQDDIAAQLGMVDASRFIYGFRRENLGIEVVEMLPSLRPTFVAGLLDEKVRRPAIVYAPTRKQAEALASQLSSKFPSAAYHAGLDASRRETVQQEFQQGRLHVVVATVAFGMGIDKADVRTIVHTSLPGTLEAYYQEIGRAGRDGLPSRAILLYSYADRRMQEFFFQRDYPPVDELERLYRRLGEEPTEKESLRAKLRMESDLFDKVLEKLVIHGGGAVDFEENAVKGAHGWRDSYTSESQRRKAQLDLAMQYAESSQCRMTSLIRHFGDLADARRPCGHCDVCAPQACVARRFRAPNESEKQTAWAVIHSLKKSSAGSTGRLHKDMFPREQVSRDEFENLLQALAGAGLVRLEELTFEKDGRTVAYRKASLTQEGEELPPTDPLDFVLPDSSNHVTTAPRKTDGKRSRAGVSAKIGTTSTRRQEISEMSAHAAAIEDKLRAWRLAEARKNDVPAFCILGNKTMRAIAQERPLTLEELRCVSGIGPAKAEKFGEEICRICAQG